jgi:hypothetical protein
LRVTQIGGRRCVDDFTVFWRGIPIGRIMKVRSGNWWWGCNVYDRVSLANDSGLISATQGQVPALTLFVAQDLPGRSVDEMKSGAGRTTDGIIIRLFFALGGLIQLVLDVQASIGTSEQDVRHSKKIYQPRAAKP